MVNTDLAEMIQTKFVENTLLKDMNLEPKHMHGALVNANEKLKNGDISEAFKEFAMLTLLDPNEISFQTGLAEAALATNQPELALQTASILITKEPQKGEGFYISGRACLAMGEIDLAVEDLQDAIARFEQHADKTDLINSARKLLSAIEKS